MAKKKELSPKKSRSKSRGRSKSSKKSRSASRTRGKSRSASKTRGKSHSASFTKGKSRAGQKGKFSTGAKANKSKSGPGAKAKTRAGRGKSQNRGSRGASKPKSIVEPQLPEIISETIIEFLHEVEAESPIDLQWENFIKIRALPVEWSNYEEPPVSLRLQNTAYSVVMTGVWPEGKTPQVTRGPLDTKYSFAQIHFHWGEDDRGGSDHSVEGASLPFEMHSVFYKTSAETLEEAKKEVDGVVIFCYFFKLNGTDNAKLKPITDNVKEVNFAYTSTELAPIPLKEIASAITDDYIVYLGSMQYKATHGVIYIVSRELQLISPSQVNVFRDLKDRHENPMILKRREVFGFLGRNIFIVNPKSFLVTSVLHQPPRTTKQSLGSKKSKRSSKKLSASKTRSHSKKRSLTKKKSASKHPPGTKKSSKKRSGSKKRSKSVKSSRSSSKKKGSAKKKSSASKKKSASKTAKAKSKAKK